MIALQIIATTIALLAMGGLVISAWIEAGDLELTDVLDMPQRRDDARFGKLGK